MSADEICVDSMEKDAANQSDFVLVDAPATVFLPGW